MVILGAAQRELGAWDMASRTAIAPMVSKRQGPDLDLLFRQQREMLRRRLASLQPAIPGGGEVLAMGSHDTGGSLHERRGRQF